MSDGIGNPFSARQTESALPRRQKPSPVRQEGYRDSVMSDTGAVPLPGRTEQTAQLGKVVVDFTSAERDAIAAHASALGLSFDEYIRQTAAERALIWQRQREAFQAAAQRRGCAVEELVRRGSLIDADP
ncbi:hypothetical protein [Streptomyces sp. NPDC001975]